MHFNSHKKGVVLLMSVLIAAVVLSVGLAVSSITYKELIIASTGRDSQVAFAAADAGIECAAYWEVRHEGLVDSPFPVGGGGTPGTFSCYNQNITPVYSVSEPAATTFSFVLDSGPSPNQSSPCVTVMVGKTANVTTIVSQGKSTCNNNNPRQTQRTLQETFTLQ